MKGARESVRLPRRSAWLRGAAMLLAVAGLLLAAPPGAAATGCPFLQDLEFQASEDHLAAPLVVHDAAGIEWDDARAFSLHIEDHQTGLLLAATWVPPELTIKAGTAEAGSYLVRVTFQPWDTACPQQEFLLQVKVQPDEQEPPPPEPPQPPPFQERRIPGWDGICPRLSTDRLHAGGTVGEPLEVDITYADGGTTWSLLRGDGLAHLEGVQFDTTGTVSWVPDQEGVYEGTVHLLTGQSGCDAALEIVFDVQPARVSAPQPRAGSAAPTPHTPPNPHTPPAPPTSPTTPTTPTTPAVASGGQDASAASAASPALRDLGPAGAQVHPIEPRVPEVAYTHCDHCTKAVPGPAMLLPVLGLWILSRRRCQ